MIGRVVGHVEEGLLALILAAMTLLTFLQVVLRYAFNSSLIWALEADTYLFAWLILIGMSYGVRVHAHIGVDLAVKALPTGLRRAAGAPGGRALRTLRGAHALRRLVLHRQAPHARGPGARTFRSSAGS